MSVHVRIHQAAALFGVFFRNRPAGQFRQRGEKAIAFEHAHRPAEFAPRDAELAFERHCRGTGVRHGAAHFQADACASHGAEAFDGRSAGGDVLVFFELRPIERLRIIGQQSGLQSEIGEHLLQVAQVGR